MLTDVPVITPENFQTVMIQAFAEYTNKLKTKLLSTNIKEENIIPMVADFTDVAIGIADYDKTKHILFVLKDGIMVNESAYTIATDNTKITFGATITATAEIPVNIKFIVVKSAVTIV